MSRKPHTTQSEGARRTEENLLVVSLSGTCLATDTQNKMFPTTDAAFMWNVRQHQNNRLSSSTTSTQKIKVLN
ncbi:hypothetical protein PAMP_002612 [Pampus punctatissimus]